MRRSRRKPSTVVVTGGGNDTGPPGGGRSPQAVDGHPRPGSGRLSPSAKIYVVNPWWDLRPVPESLAVQTSAVRAAAEAAQVTYLDTKQPLVGQPDLMVESGTNPNDAGHAALAKAVTEAIAQTANG